MCVKQFVVQKRLCVDFLCVKAFVCKSSVCKSFRARRTCVQRRLPVKKIRLACKILKQNTWQKSMVF